MGIDVAGKKKKKYPWHMSSFAMLSLSFISSKENAISPKAGTML